MARKKSTKDQEIEEDLIEIGDEEEEAVDIELNDNPNIADQLVTASDDNDEIIEEDVEDEDEPTPDTRTPEEKLNAFLEQNPDVSEYRAKDIKGRIDKLTWQQKEAERREQAATEYAQGVQRENQTLKSKQQHQDGVFIGEHKARLEAQLDTAKKQYKEAHEAGDTELIAEANALLARTSAELAQAEQTETRFQRFIKTNPEPTETEVTPYTPPPSPNAKPQIDAKAEQWAKRNEWFGEDEDMTQAALSIHETLVSQEGYIPTGDGYYAELDQRMQKNFPNKFKKLDTPTPELQGEQLVTPSTNTTTSRKPRGKRNVRLTQSQVAIAKKLGVPLEEYAKYV